MLLPEGITKYKFMRLDFVDLEKFYDSLRQDLFTGFCEFKTERTNVVQLFERGRVSRTFNLEKSVPTLLPGVSLNKLRSGEVRGVTLPPEIVDIMVRILFSKLIQTLSTAYADYRTLLKTLEKDSFTGYVEFGVGTTVHYLSMENGGPRSAFYFEGQHFLKDADALERIFHDLDAEKALINLYLLQEIPFKEVFSHLSKDLLAVYSVLKGPMLSEQLWKKVAHCAHSMNISVGDREFNLEGLPRDVRKQEEIVVSLLRCEIDNFIDELGEKTTRRLYQRILEDLESPMKELFGGVMT